MENPSAPGYDQLLVDYPIEKHKLEQIMYEWELLSEELEKLKA